MAGDAIHRIFLTVQVETFTGHDLILTQTQWLDNFVDHFSVLNEAAYDFIQVRILASLPQRRILDLEISLECLDALCGQVERPAI